MLTNKKLERNYASAEALHAPPEIARFIQRVNGKGLPTSTGRRG